MRTITEILKDADKAKSRDEVLSLWAEIKPNKYKYILVELQLAVEHINAKFCEMAEMEKRELEDLIITWCSE